MNCEKNIYIQCDQVNGYELDSYGVHLTIFQMNECNFIDAYFRNFYFTFHILLHCEAYIK